MKLIRSFLLALSAMLMLWVPQGHAEDIDIYSSAAVQAAELPNILFVIDNGANFSASTQLPCNAYSALAGGGVPAFNDDGSAPGSGASIEQCALADAIAGLPEGTVNIGILLGNANNFAQGYAGRNVNDAAYYVPCLNSGHADYTGFGGCVVRPLAKMDATNKASLVSFIKSWDPSNTPDTASKFHPVVGGGKTANMMQEAWAYYNGKKGMSGQTYTTNIAGSGCQKNFIVFIANSMTVSGTPDDNPAGADAGAKLVEAVDALGELTTDQKNAFKAKIPGPVTFDTNPTCGAGPTFPLTGASAFKADNWADEWSRFMFLRDVDADKVGSQNITTYAIGVVDPAACSPQYPALLTSTAKVGGGRYFQASDSGALVEAIGKILNEIQAVNSVFASASLPVSVNAQGTFLNQIFMGMFRPDGGGNPRWLGNLKQYQLIKTKLPADPVDGPFTGPLALGDAANKPAIDSSANDTGFIAFDAKSFWTGRNTGVQPDASGGFYQQAPIGSPPSGFDDPDGNLIEKGGAAQQLRIENMLANFAANPAGVASNPRRLYTYCPGGPDAACGSNLLSDTTNALAVENTAIPAAKFGTTSSLPISSITRVGATATVTTTGNHGLSDGATVEIQNVTQVEYNGVKTPITVTTNNKFTFTGIVENPPTPTTGTYTISTPGVGTVNIVSLSRDITGSGNTATVSVETAVPHGFTTSSKVAINNVTPLAYNLSDPSLVLLTTGVTNFTFSVSVFPTTPSSNNYQAQIYQASTVNVTTSTRAVGGPMIVDTGTPHGYHVGQTITISGSTQSRFNGDHVLTAVTATTFRATLSGNAAALTGTGGSVVPKASSQTITQITRAATTDLATATATGLPANWFGNFTGATKQVVISRATSVAGQEGYLKPTAVTITCVDPTCTSFTYEISVTPFSTGSGGSMQASLVGALTHNIAAGQITRSGTTASIAGLPATFLNNTLYNIATSGAVVPNEAPYTGLKVIQCGGGGCDAGATFGGLSVTPALTATGTGMQVKIEVPPAKDPLIRWVRGEDNYGDEFGPDPAGTPLNARTKATVRPSIHGDVLHSRPVVINYGGAKGLVVYYGANDGVFRAVNGSKTDTIAPSPAIYTVQPGGEVWGLVLPEHLKQLNRQRVNAPEVKLSDTKLNTALPKDYFVDGPTGSFQQIDASGLVETAYLYLTMRRGGRFIYAINVSNPLNPIFMWRKYGGADDLVFSEMGQTWSRPRVTVVNGVNVPVLVFAGGYDPEEDKQPPGPASMGRGIYVLNAETGAPIWRAVNGATAGCGVVDGVQTCTVPGMTHSIPSDITFRDRDSDGKTDRMYFGDTGGNVWRVDLVTSTDGTLANTFSTPANWRITKIAALGCDTGLPPCANLKAPRKFFFPPTVVSVGATGVAGSFDAVLIGSGDREHPLTSSVVGSSHLVQDRFYMIKDTLTTTRPVQSGTDLAGIDGVTVHTEATLFAAFKARAISSMSRVSGTMTVTTAAAHNFVAGDLVVIDGAERSFLDGTFEILSASGSTFTYASPSPTDITAGAFGNATVRVPFTSASRLQGGFYIYLALGEKVVNAPITVSGETFFGTNRPEAVENNTCKSNLGQARGYGISPFTGVGSSTIYDGGGLPPSPVAGVIEIIDPVTGAVTLERFCIGCGGGSDNPNIPPCDSALQQCSDPPAVPKKPTRTYWYRK